MDLPTPKMVRSLDARTDVRPGHCVWASDIHRLTASRQAVTGRSQASRTDASDRFTWFVCRECIFDLFIDVLQH
jgi:hypothetical protein